MTQLSEALQTDTISRMRPRVRPAAIFLVTGFLVCISAVVFLMDSTSERVNALIVGQNAASLKLWNNLEYYERHRQVGAAERGDATPQQNDAPPGLINELVEFSRTNANIIKVAHRLSPWHFFTSVGLKDIPEVDEGTRFDHRFVNPETFDSGEKIRTEVIYQIRLYQGIRAYAEDHAAMDKTCITALSIYVLPCLYALLGAFLYSGRCHANGKCDRLERRGDRYAMAFILGATISVFSSVIPKDLLLSPLAIAFLAGYSVDAFTSRLDALVDKLQFRPERSAVHMPRRGRGAEAATKQLEMIVPEQQKLLIPQRVG